MRVQLLSRLSRRQWSIYNGLNIAKYTPPSSRQFHASSRVLALKPFLLADIGEGKFSLSRKQCQELIVIVAGIRECEIIQWFVEPEARVEEWDKLCEVQSDKASVEITSRFSGVIKKLHYDAGEMAQVGKPLLDIDIQGEIKDEDLAALTGEGAAEEPQTSVKDQTESGKAEEISVPTPEQSKPARPVPSGKHASLATPAVRHMIKSLGVNITDVEGTGKDGRVSKEDVQRYVKGRDSKSSSTSQQFSTPPTTTAQQEEILTPLTTIQTQMFKSMTKSLSIPHFVFADELDFSAISQLRSTINKGLAKSPTGDVSKVSYMPFIIKAVSLALNKYPILNARIETDQATSKPALYHRSHHNIGVAMDTPSGLIVPVIKNVSSLSILQIASELSRLQALAASGKLSSQDLSGGTITVSNIGNIGGTYLAPVIVEKQVAILGMGKIKTMPAFDENDNVVKKQVCNFSWSADHRVVDGATMARAAEIIRGFVERPETMVMQLS